jgi:hypothetical protein
VEQLGVHAADGTGEVWRDADEVVAFDFRADPHTQRIGGRPDVPVPLGMPSLQHPDRPYVLWPSAGPGLETA